MTDEELAQMKQRVDMMFEANYSAAALNYLLSELVTLLVARLAKTTDNPRDEVLGFMREARLAVTRPRELHSPHQYKGAEYVDQTLADLEASILRHLDA